jgi:hypothetical protein
VRLASLADLSTAVLWGEADPWEQTVAQLRANSAGMGNGLMVSALVFVFSVAVWVVVRNRLEKRSERVLDDSRKLFRDLCRAQRLSWKETALLEDLADRRGLETPSLLFVREEYFEGDDEGVDERTRRDTKALGERLFA